MNVVYNAGLRLRCTPDLNATLDNLRVFAQLVSPEFYDIFTEGLFCECSHGHYLPVLRNISRWALTACPNEMFPVGQ